MKKIIIEGRLIALFLFSASLNEIYAQSIRIDTIVQLISNSKSEKGIDTSRFDDAVKRIERTTLDNESIEALENAGNLFVKGNGEYWNYRIRLSILNSLIATDKVKSISYGKQQLAELENSRTPNAILIRSVFLKQLRLPYRNSNLLSEGFQYFNDNLKKYRLKNDSAGLADCYYVLGGFYRTIGLLDQAIYHMKKSVSYMRKDTLIDKSIPLFGDPVGRGNWFNNIGVIGSYNLQKGDYNEALKYSRITFNEDRRASSVMTRNSPNTMAQIKLLSGELDSVMYYLDMIFNHDNNKSNPDYSASALQIKGFYKIQAGKLEEAETALKQCWQMIGEYKIPADARPGTMAPDYYLALIRIQQNKIDEAIAFLEKDIDRLKSQRLNVLRDYKLLAKLHDQSGNHKSANYALQAFISLQDSLQADQAKYGSLSFETEQELSAKELSISKLQSENKISGLSRNFSIGIAVLLFVLAGSIYNRLRSKRRANEILENTLSELKSTQVQLIQTEKMASLGELTAGIAHEIQNPLNFVNNFSEVSHELIDEMKEELVNGNAVEAIAIADDVKQNLEKISHHGKRADAIVKSMLQHSQSSTGAKEPTDINALCDEYLRLAYHGLRAKDNAFNAAFSTDFDATVGMVQVILQEMGRVLLNLINNAFYAVAEKSRTAGPHYQPAVSISTRKIDNKVEISVTDNGNGIPEAIREKIFQPFFTTKPTGQGTGLGLSLSYDIVKGHGGELKVDTRVGEGTEFKILLNTTV